MKIVSFDQGSDSWLKWRKGGIGASDISIIMGSNPYKTPLQLWEIKCGYREEDVVNRAMQHGINHEDVARQWLNQNLQLHLQPVCVEDDDKSHFRASLDGYDFDHETLVEIKCPISEKVFDLAPIAKPSRLISAKPRHSSAAFALSPAFMPSIIPAAIAITFFIAPANSTPVISVFV